MIRRIAMTGAGGMLGHDLVHVFGGEDIIAYGFKDLDITNQEAVFERLITIQPDVVINATGYTDVDRAETEEELANSVNGYAIGNLAKACREIDATLVHFSTDYVFKGDKKGGYNEEDVTSPINAYGRSKAKGEEALQRLCHLYYLVRTSWLYGAGGKNFVTTMLDLAKTKSALRVVDDQHGKPTFTDDLAFFIKLLVLEKAPTGIYHGVNEGETTWCDLTKEIFKQAGVTSTVQPCTSAEFPRPAKRPEWSTLINTKRPLMRPWPEALRDFLFQLGYPPTV